MGESVFGEEGSFGGGKRRREKDEVSETSAVFSFVFSFVSSVLPRTLSL